MKKITLIIMLGGAAMFASCQKEPTSYAGTPIASISVTVSGETVRGVVDDVNRKVQFTFSNAETFSSCDIAIEVNDGWKLTFPTTLTGVNLQSTPTLNFMDPDKATVKYGVTFSSNAFPVVDASRIQVAGLQPGENISLDNAAKVISILYDQDKIDFENVTLVFNDGALQEGVTTPADLNFDFTEGLEQDLVFKLGGDRVYTLKMDVSPYLKSTPSALGFLDESAVYGADGIEVYSSQALTGIPVYCTSTFWCPSNPRDWEHPEEIPEGGHYSFAKDIFSFPGDWTADRPTMNTFGRLVIVYIDQAKFSADIVANTGYEKKLGDMSNTVVATGIKISSLSAIHYMVYDEHNTANEGTGALWRNAIGVTAKGNLSFAYAAKKSDGLYQIAPQTSWFAEEGAAEAIVAAADKKWNVKDAAWVNGQAIRDGKSLKVSEIVMCDGSQFISDNGVLGMGWNGFYQKRIVVGQTYDNKIALMVSSGGIDLWDGTNQPACSNDFDWGDRWGAGTRGYSTPQMMWIAGKLGWKNASLMTTSDDEEDSQLPNIRIKGKALIQQSDSPNTEDVYLNDGAAQTGSYFLTFDARK